MPLILEVGFRQAHHTELCSQPAVVSLQLQQFVGSFTWFMLLFRPRLVYLFKTFPSKPIRF